MQLLLMFVLLLLSSANAYTQVIHNYLSRRGSSLRKTRSLPSILYMTVSCDPAAATSTSGLPNHISELYHIFVWHEGGDAAIRHLYLFRKRRWRPLWIISLLHWVLPKQLRLKPIAKCGIRSYSSTTQSMSDLLNSVFDQSAASHQDAVVGLMVYMWAQPDLRGSADRFGDALLAWIKQQCRDKGDTHLLLVHDDSGNGKLIDYYQQRDFVPIFDFLEKGMVCTL